MNLLNVKIKNFKCLKDIDVNLEGKSIVLIGKNARGKSSFIQAINIALGLDKDIPENPITNGMKEGEIQVMTGQDGKKYEFSVRLREGKDPILGVRTDGGVKITEKNIISQLVGGADIDIFEFVELSKTKPGKRKQVEIIKSYLPQETIDALDALKKKVADKIEERKNLKRDISTYEGFIQQSGMLEGEISKYAKKKDTIALQKDQSEAIQHNNKIIGVKDRMNERELRIGRNTADIIELEKRIENIKLENTMLLTQNAEAVEFLKNEKPKDTTIWIQSLKEAEEHNIKCEKALELKSKIDKLNELRSSHEDIDIFVKSSSSEIEEFVKSSPLPIPGLTFTDDALFYNGIEVSEASLSTSEIMMIGARLKMAKNPKVKLLTISRCESLDEDKLQELINFAHKYDFQLILETVDKKQEELKVEFIKG